LPRSTSDLLVGLSGISAGTSSNPILDFIVECIPNSNNSEWTLSTALNGKIRKNADFGIARCRAGRLKYQVDWEGRLFGSSRVSPAISTLDRPLPVHTDERTSADRLGMSQRRQQRNGLIRSPRRRGQGSVAALLTVASLTGSNIAPPPDQQHGDEDLPPCCCRLR
jgi:hypothetical protein